MDQQRIESLEGEIKEIWEEVGKLKDGQNTLITGMELIKNDMSYLRMALTKIDSNVDILTKASHREHFEEPLSMERTRKERRRSQIENVIIGIFIGYILIQLFPMLAR